MRQVIVCVRFYRRPTDKQNVKTHPLCLFRPSPWFLILTLAVSLIPLGHAADSMEDILRLQMDQMVREQYRITQDALQVELSLANARLKVIENEKAGVLARAKVAADIDAKGIAQLKKYDALIAARYVDKKGNYHGGFQLVQTDVDAINDLLKTYLRSSPLTDKVSAGQARRTLAYSIDRLEDIRSAHASPTETNNSDLEILAKIAHDEEARSKKVLDLAATINVTVDPNRPLPPAPRVVAQSPEPARKPASTGKQAPSATQSKRKTLKKSH